MSDLSSAQSLAERTSRAVTAATTAGRELGLTVTEPTVLHDVFSVVVHLAPSPVVARVPTVLPSILRADLAALATRQRRELELVAWLAAQGLPTVPPSPLVPAEPVQYDGFSMTMWQFVTHHAGESEPDYVRAAALTADLHATLREYPGELPFMAPTAMISPSLVELADRPDLLDPVDLERARREWAVLEPVVGSLAGFQARFPDVEPQALHGDCPPFNLIITDDGDQFADFEDSALGPAEWDMALMSPEAKAAYNTAAVRVGLRPLDEQVQAAMDTVRMLQLVALLAMTPQLPMLADGLKSALEQWRTMPIAR